MKEIIKCLIDKFKNTTKTNRSNIKKIKNSIHPNMKNVVSTPYGELYFSVRKSTKGYEVYISLNNNYIFCGEYGYGFYDYEYEAKREIKDDIHNLVINQKDADKMFSILDNPNYLKSIEKK